MSDLVGNDEARFSGVAARIRNLYGRIKIIVFELTVFELESTR